MNRMVEILIVEDSPTQAAQLQNLLEDCGYTVQVATDGLLALEAARHHKPDLVISDIVMPKMDGYQLCNEIKADPTLRNIPVVLVTSLSSPHDVIRGLGCGADSFIRKPYDEKYLISRIEYLRANQALRQQEQSQMGLEMYLGGQRHFITAERQQILDLLISTYTEAIRLNEGLNRSNQWLHGLYRIAEGMNQAANEQEVCEMAVAGAVELPGIQASWIVLNANGAANRVMAVEGLPEGHESLDTLQSHASINLWAGEQIYGVMNLIGTELVEFSDEDLSIMQGVGNQVGIALERAHLRSYLEKMVEERTAALQKENAVRKLAEEEARRHAARAEALVRSANRLNADLDLSVILDAICEEASQALAVPVVTLSFYDKEVGHFYHVKDLGLPLTYRQLVRPVRPQPNQRAVVGISTTQSDAQRPLIIYEMDLLKKAEASQDEPTDEADADPNVELYAPFGFRTMVSVDLTYAQELIGRFAIYTLGEPRQFSEGELSLLQGLGNQASQAIVNARLFADAERRMEQLHALHAIDKAIIAVQELPVSLDMIVKQIAAQLKVDAVDVLLYEEKSETLSYTAGTGFRKNVYRTPMRLGEGHVGRVAELRHVDFVPDLNQCADFERAPLLKEEGFVSYFGVPLIVQGQLKGVLEIFHRSQLDPKSEWLGFLQALALQTAIATTHAELFSQTRHLLQRTQKEARKVKQIMDAVPEGVIFLAQDQRIQLANEMGEQYLRLLTDAKVGEPLTRLGEHPLTALIDQARVIAWQELSIREGQHIFEIAARPMQVNSHVEGWVLVLRDVTFERQSQQRMQVQERLATVGQLAAGIAHDFNNLLVPIMLYTELLIANAPREGRMWSNLEKILLAANRAKELVRQILAFSRQGPSQEQEPVQLQRHIQEVLKLMWASLPASIEVREEIAPGVGSVLANPVEIHQILMNLCTNAYHAMRPSGGILTVRLDKINVDPDFAASRSHLKLGPYVRLAVSDTGHGMEPSTMERIFDPFFTTKAAGEGTGMGLSVVYGIVMSYGGDILVESVPGRGTTFWIYLPELPTAVEQDEVNELMAVGGNEHILLVDDEESIVLATQTLLSSLGYAVTTYTSSLDALAHFRQKPAQFDLVITDLTMPQMDGIAFAREVLAIRPDLPILLISGAHEKSTAETAKAIGVDASVMKPFQTQELATRIRYLLVPEA